MDQIAGHVTNYHNLREAAQTEPEFNASWYEIHYYKSGGAIEKLRERVVPFVPTYFSGISRGAWETHKALRGQRFDALFSNASVGVFFSRTFRHIPTMIDFDSTPHQIDQMAAYSTGSPDPKPVAQLKWRLSQRMMEAAALLQAWSNWAKDSAIRDYGADPNKVIVNPPGIKLDFWKPAPERAERDASQPRRILFVGGDFRRKGGPVLLEWFRHQAAGAYELHIVTREAVDTAPGVYVYHNMQPNSAELLKLYHQSDLFVLPSLGECFGIATVEAMGAGLPVITSDVGGVADIVDVGGNGFIVPSDNAAELGQAIAGVFADEQRRVAMGIQSRALAEQRFDVRRNAARTFGYLRQLADEHTLPNLKARVERSDEV
ncbi:MAG TPA: glycosyltransferase family 4 protein [Kouleothrix sp.]|uniref:glycosyltransferase family 4 protein n=1 Tax=Kouleothrix sp. TaxID=2779161 RepID=UPI002D18D3D0|nr:glycosyltransferase family 4 protein [Kouleothrix sp.]